MSSTGPERVPLPPKQPAWIALLSSAALESHLARADPAGPLYGVPFAIKDNIDLAGVPTTAACSHLCPHPQTPRWGS